jgi:hypothetical protein
VSYEGLRTAARKALNLGDGACIGHEHDLVLRRGTPLRSSLKVSSDPFERGPAPATPPDGERLAVALDPAAFRGSCGGVEIPLNKLKKSPKNARKTRSQRGLTA